MLPRDRFYRIYVVHHRYRVLGGVIVGKESLIKEIHLFCRSTGPALSPFNAWVLSKSLETLDVRMERHAGNALYLSEQLQNHSAFASLRYPFLPSIHK